MIILDFKNDIDKKLFLDASKFLNTKIYYFGNINTSSRDFNISYNKLPSLPCDIWRIDKINVTQNNKHIVLPIKPIQLSFNQRSNLSILKYSVITTKSKVFEKIISYLYYRGISYRYFRYSYGYIVTPLSRRVEIYQPSSDTNYVLTGTHEICNVPDLGGKYYDIVDGIVVTVDYTAFFNLLRSNKYALQKKQIGSPILSENVELINKIDFINSEYYTTEYHEPVYEVNGEVTYFSEAVYNNSSHPCVVLSGNFLKDYFDKIKVLSGNYIYSNIYIKSNIYPDGTVPEGYTQWKYIRRIYRELQITPKLIGYQTLFKQTTSESTLNYLIYSKQPSVRNLIKDIYIFSKIDESESSYIPSDIDLWSAGALVIDDEKYFLTETLSDQIIDSDLIYEYITNGSNTGLISDFFSNDENKEKKYKQHNIDINDYLYSYVSGLIPNHLRYVDIDTQFNLYHKIPMKYTSSLSQINFFINNFDQLIKQYTPTTIITEQSNLSNYISLNHFVYKEKHDLLITSFQKQIVPLSSRKMIQSLRKISTFPITDSSIKSFKTIDIFTKQTIRKEMLRYINVEPSFEKYKCEDIYKYFTDVIQNDLYHIVLGQGYYHKQISYETYKTELNKFYCKDFCHILNDSELDLSVIDYKDLQQIYGITEVTHYFVRVLNSDEDTYFFKTYLKDTDLDVHSPYKEPIDSNPIPNYKDYFYFDFDKDKIVVTDDFLKDSKFKNVPEFINPLIKNYKSYAAQNIVYTTNNPDIKPFNTSEYQNSNSEYMVNHFNDSLIYKDTIIYEPSLVILKKKSKRFNFKKIGLTLDKISKFNKVLSSYEIVDTRSTIFKRKFIIDHVENNDYFKAEGNLTITYDNIQQYVKCNNITRHLLYLTNEQHDYNYTYETSDEKKFEDIYTFFNTLNEIHNHHLDSFNNIDIVIEYPVFGVVFGTISYKNLSYFKHPDTFRKFTEQNLLDTSEIEKRIYGNIRFTSVGSDGIVEKMEELLQQEIDNQSYKPTIFTVHILFVKSDLQYYVDLVSIPYTISMPKDNSFENIFEKIQNHLVLNDSDDNTKFCIQTLYDLQYDDIDKNKYNFVKSLIHYDSNRYPYEIDMLKHLDRNYANIRLKFETHEIVVFQEDIPLRQAVIEIPEHITFNQQKYDGLERFLISYINTVDELKDFLKYQDTDTFVDKFGRIINQYDEESQRINYIDSWNNIDQNYTGIDRYIINTIFKNYKNSYVSQDFDYNSLLYKIDGSKIDEIFVTKYFNKTSSTYKKILDDKYTIKLQDELSVGTTKINMNKLTPFELDLSGKTCRRYAIVKVVKTVPYISTNTGVLQSYKQERDCKKDSVSNYCIKDIDDYYQILDDGKYLFKKHLMQYSTTLYISKNKYIQKPVKDSDDNCRYELETQMTTNYRDYKFTTQMCKYIVYGAILNNIFEKIEFPYHRFLALMHDLDKLSKAFPPNFTFNYFKQKIALYIQKILENEQDLEKFYGISLSYFSKILSKRSTCSILPVQIVSCVESETLSINNTIILYVLYFLTKHIVFYRHNCDEIICSKIIDICKQVDKEFQTHVPPLLNSGNYRDTSKIIRAKVVSLINKREKPQGAVFDDWYWETHNDWYDPIQYSSIIINLDSTDIIVNNNQLIPGKLKHIDYIITQTISKNISFSIEKINYKQQYINIKNNIMPLLKKNYQLILPEYTYHVEELPHPASILTLDLEIDNISVVNEIHAKTLPPRSIGHLRFFTSEFNRYNSGAKFYSQEIDQYNRLYYINYSYIRFPKYEIFNKIYKLNYIGWDPIFDLQIPQSYIDDFEFLLNKHQFNFYYNLNVSDDTTNISNNLIKLIQTHRYQIKAIFFRIRYFYSLFNTDTKFNKLVSNLKKIISNLVKVFGNKFSYNFILEINDAEVVNVRYVTELYQRLKDTTNEIVLEISSLENEVELIYTYYNRSPLYRTGRLGLALKMIVVGDFFETYYRIIRTTQYYLDFKTIIIDHPEFINVDPSAVTYSDLQEVIKNSNGEQHYTDFIKYIYDKYGIKYQPKNNQG